MQNYRVGPVGPVGARGVPRGTRENLGRARSREGDATRGPGSTSTHLNFGPSQGQCGRTIRPSLLPSSPSPRLVSFLLVRASHSLCPSFSRPLGFPPPYLPLPPSTGSARTALSCHTVLGPTPSPVPSQVLFFFFFLHGPTYDPAKSQLVEIPV